VRPPNCERRGRIRCSALLGIPKPRCAKCARFEAVGVGWGPRSTDVGDRCTISVQRQDRASGARKASGTAARAAVHAAHSRGQAGQRGGEFLCVVRDASASGSACACSIRSGRTSS
jgi:hypothetical protein